MTHFDSTPTPQGGQELSVFFLYGVVAVPEIESTWKEMRKLWVGVDSDNTIFINQQVTPVQSQCAI